MVKQLQILYMGFHRERLTFSVCKVNCATHGLSLNNTQAQQKPQVSDDEFHIQLVSPHVQGATSGQDQGIKKVLSSLKQDDVLSNHAPTPQTMSHIVQRDCSMQLELNQITSQQQSQLALETKEEILSDESKKVGKNVWERNKKFVIKLYNVTIWTAWACSSCPRILNYFIIDIKITVINNKIVGNQFVRRLVSQWRRHNTVDISQKKIQQKIIKEKKRKGDDHKGWSKEKEEIKKN
eukprot:TRINITY_DN5398_c1_g2_i1.p2 TRINITY_DN5398_c1_g2~~TRINITY_DN5398_c1_g2_i1.p2  ORF type:complete len:237 (+),score=5.41 TRINITY_DN5398_c1_g2_i1:148-858(+)